MPTVKAKPKPKPAAKAKRTRRKPFDVNGFIDRAPDNPDPRCRAWATVLWLARTQGTHIVVWNDDVAATYFGLFLAGDALQALEESGLCSIEWGEDGDVDARRMPDVPIITILTRETRKRAKP